MSRSSNSQPQPEGTDVPVSLRALMQQLGQVAGALGASSCGRFFEAFRAICLTVDPSLLCQSQSKDVADFLAATRGVEEQVEEGKLDDEASLDALMTVLAVHGYLSAAARPVLTDRLARSLASYRSAFWQEDESPATETAGASVAAEVVDWNALGSRLMRPAGDHVGLAHVESEGDSGWEAFPNACPSGPTLH